MNKIKEKFEEWLLKQGLAEKTKSGRLSTIYNYTNTIDKICKKSFKINDEVGWHYLAENIYQELARFYELSNKDYFLDAITIRYALFYFQKVSNFIYSKLKADENNNVNLYLNFKNTDYLILATKLNELFQYALLFDTLVFGRKHHQITLNQENENHFLKNLDNILYHIIYPKIGDKSQLKHHIMLHVSYSKKHLRKEKTALLKYHNFLYPSQNVLENQLLYMVAKANPERRIGGNYIVKREVSGSSCMVLDFNDNNNLETDDVDIGVGKDLIRGCAWWEMAAFYDYKPAKEALLKQRKEMTVGQYQKAKKEFDRLADEVMDKIDSPLFRIYEHYHSHNHSWGVKKT